MAFRRAALASFLLALGASLLVALTSAIGLDYYVDAAPGIQALSAGDLTRWAAEQPQMGQFSIVLRAPVAVLGLGELWTYRLGSLLLLLGPLALFLYLRRTASLSRLGVGVLLAATCLNPMTFRALHLGHPEEVLGGALCALSLLLALDDQFAWAGLTLGLALGTKQWALFAVLPVLFACASGAERRRLLLVAVPVAALLTVPPVLMDPHAFMASMARPIGGISIMRPGNLWSMMIPPREFVDVGGEVIGRDVVPHWLRAIAHPMVIGVALLLALGWRRRMRVPADSALALLALVFLSRCALDPWNHGYYHWPFIAALASWEIRGLRRPPLVTAVSSGCLWLCFSVLHDELMDLAYVTWAAFLLVWLVGEAFGPPLRAPAREAVLAHS